MRALLQRLLIRRRDCPEVLVYNGQSVPCDLPMHHPGDWHQAAQEVRLPDRPGLLPTVALPPVRWRLR